MTKVKEFFWIITWVFNPKYHMPPVKPSKYPILPCKSKMFYIFRSIKNSQFLTKLCICCKYYCKQVTNIDWKNYLIIKIDKYRTRKLVTKSYFLWNKKIASSKIK